MQIEIKVMQHTEQNSVDVSTKDLTNNTVISQIPGRHRFPAEMMGRAFLHNIPPLEEFQRTQWQERPLLNELRQRNVYSSSGLRARLNKKRLTFKLDDLYRVRV